MPIYDYRCPSCGRVDDRFCNRRDSEIVVCPGCGDLMRRLLSAGTKYRVPSGQFFEPYTTRDITGEPITVRSRDHLSALCRQHNVTAKPTRAKLK